MSKILVIGSSNTDLIAKVDRFPAAGETIQGNFFLQAFGGKGANQALAAHRLGGEVSFVTCLGNDANGQNTKRYYQSEGLDIASAVTVEDTPTGTAMILVNKEGENCIVITPGANDKLTPDYIDTIENEIARARIVVLQMEIPFESVRRVCQLASRHDTEVLLNVAPAREIDEEILRMVSLLVVNEVEIEKISGLQISQVGEDGVIDKLRSMGAQTVILTLGRKGCIVKNGALHRHIPAFQVNAVDTTAAGDTFCGSLVAQLSAGRQVVEALTFATAAAALCVTRMGAQPSIPTEAEVETFLRRNGGESSDKSTAGKPAAKST